MRILAFLLLRGLQALVVMALLIAVAAAIGGQGGGAPPAPDEGFAEGFADRLKASLRGDFGPSALDGQPALAVVLERLPATLALLLAAGLATALLAVPAGMHAAAHPEAPTAHLIRGAALVGAAVPGFLVALLLLRLVHGEAALPLSGAVDPLAAPRPSGAPAALWLPAAALAAILLGGCVRRVRHRLAEELARAHVLFARARGLAPRILRRNALHNARAGLLRDAGLLTGLALAQAAVVEAVLGWPGAGALTLEAALAGDRAVLAALVPVAGGVVLAARALLDLAALVADAGTEPR